MKCYGMPRMYCFAWSRKDIYEGPRTIAYKRRLRRIMRSKARQTAKKALKEQ
jgi:hypothetical protein